MNSIPKKTVSHRPPQKPGAKGSPFFQPRLAVGPTHDRFEQEADAMADHVMRMPSPIASNTAPVITPVTSPLQRCACQDEEVQRKEEKDETDTSLPAPLITTAGDGNDGMPSSPTALADEGNFFHPVTPLQRKCAACEEEDKSVQRKETALSAGPETASPLVSHTLQQTGQSLDKPTQQFMEGRFGHRFDHVKVHTGAVAAKSAQAINALAYTSGSHVVFNQGQYAPATDTGKKLLAHELTHVIQQGKGAPSGPIQRKPSPYAANNCHKTFQHEFDGTVTSATGEVAYTVNGIPTQDKPHGTPAQLPGGKTVKINHGEEVPVGQLGQKYWRATCLLIPGRTTPEIHWLRASAFSTSSAQKNTPAPAAPTTSAAFKVIPHCPPQAEILGSFPDEDIAQELYGNSFIPIAYAEPYLVNVDYASLLPHHKPAFADCVSDEEKQAPIVPPAVFDESAHIQEYLEGAAMVVAPRGIRLHTTPRPDDEDYVHYKRAARHVIPPGSTVTLVAQGNDRAPDWTKITDPTTGNSGWIESSHLDATRASTTHDAVTKKIYLVQKGDTLEALINKEYKDYPFATGNDRRTIVHALYVLNENSHAFYFTGDGTSFWKDLLDAEMAETRQIYATIKLRQDKLIRLPTHGYIDLLRDQGIVGKRADWKNQAIALARSVEGFVAGVVSGFLKAIVDTVTGLWDLIKGIFTGELFKQAYEFYKQIEKNGLKFLWELIKGFFIGTYNDFKAAWNNPNPYKKWFFFGELVGMILFEIVVAYFTAGAGASKHLAKLDKIMDAVPGLKKLKKLAPKHVDDIPPGKAKALKTIKQAESKIEELGDMTGETRKMLRDPKHKDLLDSLSENKRAARILKKCNSPCYPDFAQPEQIKYFDDMIRKAEMHDLPVDEDALRDFLHKAPDADDLNERLEDVRRIVDAQVEAKARGVDTPMSDRLVSAQRHRHLTAAARGGDKLPTYTLKNIDTLFDPAGRIGQIPKQVADAMRGRTFTSWRNFRETFWRAMYDDDIIRGYFEKRNATKSLAEMKKGHAPYALRDQQVGGGGNAKLQLNHQQALEHFADDMVGDAVYDFDNLEMISPKFHEAMKQ